MGVLAGYLSREDAVAYRPVIDRVAASGRVMMCYASLTGGWDRGVSFGVILRIGQPWTLMAELDRDMGPDPRWPPEVVNAGPDERPYNRTDCPYCGEELHPLPKRRRACKSCGQAVSVQSGPDGIRYLLREADLAAHQARWDAFFGGQRAAAAVTVSIQATRTVASYAAHGVRFVDMTPALPDACAACLAVAGRRFALPDAPSIPTPECSNELCRCDYLPVPEGGSAP
ncbi:MAG: hypothetical protein WD116_02135 [Chloroflexota bacterium]